MHRKKPQLIVGALRESVGNGNFYDTALCAPKNDSATAGLNQFCFSIFNLRRVICALILTCFAMQR